VQVGAAIYSGLAQDLGSVAALVSGALGLLERRRLKPKAA